MGVGDVCGDGEELGKSDIQNGHIWIYRVSSGSYLSHCAYRDVMEAGDRA